jgi:hypothetical protein
VRDTFRFQHKQGADGRWGKICLGFCRMSISHAALGHLRCHQQRLDGVDVEVVIDGVGRELAVWPLGTVEGIRAVAAAHRRHLNVTV